MERKVGGRAGGGGAAGEDVDFFPEGERAGGDGAGTLALQRAVVEPALTRNHEIGDGEARLKVQPRGDKVETGEELRAGGATY